MRLLQLSQEFEIKGISIASLRKNIDTSTATSRAFFSNIGAIKLKAERTAAGRASAKARGKAGGRPRTDPAKLEQARVLCENTDATAEEIYKYSGVGRRTFFEYLKRRRSEEQVGQ